MDPLEVESVAEPFIEPEIVESFRALPTEDDLPCDDGEPTKHTGTARSARPTLDK
jgi:hypothetical protein